MSINKVNEVPRNTSIDEMESQPGKSASMHSLTSMNNDMKHIYCPDLRNDKIKKGSINKVNCDPSKNESDKDLIHKVYLDFC